MADVKYATQRASLTATGSGTTDVTVSGFGTPVAAIILFSNANTTNNPQDDSNCSVGFFDGTNTRCCGYASDDGGGTSDTARVDSTTRGAINYDAATSAITAGYSVAAITDGLRFTLEDDSTGAQRYVTVLMFGGADCNADAGTIDPDTSQDGTTSISSLSYTSDLIFFVCTGQGSAGGAAEGVLSFGVCKGSDLTQRATAIWGQNAQTTANTGQRVWTDRVGGQFFNGSVSWSGEVTAVASDGFTLTTRDGGSGGDQMYWLALDLAGASTWVGTLTTPTSTGDDANTSPGFEPSALLTSLTGCTAVDTATDHAQFGGGVSDGTTDSSFAVHDEDNVGTSNCASESNSTATEMLASSGGTTIAATLSSFDASGFTLNYSAVDASARKGMAVAFEELTDADASSIPIRRNQMRFLSQTW